MDTIKLRNSLARDMSNSLVMMAVSHFAFLSSRTSSGHFFFTVFFRVMRDKVDKRGLLVVYTGRVQSYQSINQSIHNSNEKSFSFSICRVVALRHLRKQCFNLLNLRIPVRTFKFFFFNAGLLVNLTEIL